jgi:hypothetical protein
VPAVAFLVLPLEIAEGTGLERGGAAARRRVLREAGENC